MAQTRRGSRRMQPPRHQRKAGGGVAADATRGAGAPSGTTPPLPHTPTHGIGRTLHGEDPTAGTAAIGIVTGIVIGTVIGTGAIGRVIGGADHPRGAAHPREDEVANGKRTAAPPIQPNAHTAKNMAGTGERTRRDTTRRHTPSVSSTKISRGGGRNMSSGSWRRSPKFHLQKQIPRS